MMLKYRYYSITLIYKETETGDCKIFKKSQRGIEFESFASAKGVQFFWRCGGEKYQS